MSPRPSTRGCANGMTCGEWRAYTRVRAGFNPKNRTLYRLNDRIPVDCDMCDHESKRQAALRQLNHAAEGDVQALLKSLPASPSPARSPLDLVLSAIRCFWGRTSRVPLRHFLAL